MAWNPGWQPPWPAQWHAPTSQWASYPAPGPAPAEAPSFAPPRARSRSSRRHSEAGGDTLVSHKLRIADKDLPSEWSPDRQHFDTNLVYDMDFPRNVAATRWSREKGIQGMPIEEVPVHKLFWNGIRHFDLRTLAQGRYMGLHVTRTASESMFLESILWQVRELKKANPDFDLSAVAQFVATEQNLPNKSGPERKQVMESLAKTLLSPLSEIAKEPAVQGPTSQALLLNQVKDLQEQLRAANSNQATPIKAPAGPPNKGLLSYMVNSKSPAGKGAPATPATPAPLGPRMPGTPLLPQEGHGDKHEEGVPPEEPQGFDKFTRKERQAVLEQTAPPTLGKAKFKDWQDSIVSKWRATKRVAFLELVNEIRAAYDNIEPSEQPKLSRILCEWGLDPEMSVNAKTPQVWVLLAIANTLTQ